MSTREIPIQLRASPLKPAGDDDVDINIEARAPSPIALNETWNSNSSRNAQQANQSVGSLAKMLAIQEPLFVLESFRITPKDAEGFYTQAQRLLDSMSIEQVMNEVAMDMFDIRITADITQTTLPQSEVPFWRLRLTHLKVAEFRSRTVLS